MHFGASIAMPVMERERSPFLILVLVVTAKSQAPPPDVQAAAGRTAYPQCKVEMDYPITIAENAAE